MCVLFMFLFSQGNPVTFTPLFYPRLVSAVSPHKSLVSIDGYDLSPDAKSRAVQIIRNHRQSPDSEKSESSAQHEPDEQTKPDVESSGNVENEATSDASCPQEDEQKPLSDGMSGYY